MDISVVSLKDGSLLVGEGQKTFLSAPHPTLPSWYAPDFFLEHPMPWHTHENYFIKEGFSFPKQYARMTEPLDFKPMFDDMRLKKAVAYTFCPLENFSWESALQHLSERGRRYFLYATDGIMGASPEILFDLEKGRLITWALAATAKNPEELEGAKEVEEHAIVVEGIKAALSGYGNVVVKPKEIATFGTLHHLKQEIELQASLTFEEAVKALHPTPALGAWPRDEGTLWLKKWGCIVPRGRFGAPFGYSFPERDESRAFVAIRCVQWEGEEAALWAGAGITEKSSFAKESAEVLQKLSNTAFLMGI